MAKGSVRKKGKKWYYRFYVEDASGKMVQKEYAGTEPKIKFYYGVKGTSLDDAEVKSKAVGDELMGMVDKMM